MAQFPTFGNATGVWNINDVYNNVSGGTWPNFGAIGLVGGGFTPGYNSIINSVNIATAGNATVFGDLTLARGEFGAASNFTRCLWAGGVNGVTPTNTSNTIDYVTFSTTGNAADFGDLLAVTQRSTGAGGNATRSVWTEGSGDTDQIVFLNPTIFSNATDFGNLTVARTFVGAMSSPTRVVFAGGFSPLLVNNIDFIETATTGNATDFGDLVAGTRGGGTFSSSTRGVYGGGASPTLTNVIQFITIASAGNATDYGDLTAAIDEPSGTSNSVRGLFFNGRTPVLLNEIQILNIPSGGNTTDFGDTTSQVYSAAANSNSHGGLSDGYQGTRPAVFFNQGDLAVTAGGSSNTINSFKISQNGNAIDFGDLSVSVTSSRAIGNETRFVNAGGQTPSLIDVIEYVNFSSQGNAADFGNLLVAARYGGTVGNSTRGIFAGMNTPSAVNVIQYIAFQSLGNTADFGDLQNANNGGLLTAGSPTKGLLSGGMTPGSYPNSINVIDEVTIATTGNAIDFGDLTVARRGGGGASSETRAVFMSGRTSPGSITNVMDFVTIASAGNATDFGDLTPGRYSMQGTSNKTRGVVAGGEAAAPISANTNEIVFIIIATTGNSSDYGDLTYAAGGVGVSSNGHGGLNGDTLPSTPDRGLFKTGPSSAPTYSVDNVIEFINIASAGNASDFGDLTAAGYTLGTGIASSNTQGIFFGNSTGPFTSATNVINIVIISTLGNASDFGDLTDKNIGGGGLSNQVRGIYGGGFPSPGGFPNTNTIQFITIQSLGNTIDFGDLTQVINEVASTASPTRGVWAGGNSSPVAPANTSNVIGYVTIATTGNAIDFGDLTQTMRGVQGLSSNTRGIFAGSSLPVANVISFITIASTGNATDFGDLLSSVNQTIPSSNSITGLFAGGAVSPSESATNVINSITIATEGNATDFGDLTRAGRSGAGASGSQGGLQ